MSFLLFPPDWSRCLWFIRSCVTPLSVISGEFKGLGRHPHPYWLQNFFSKSRFRLFLHSSLNAFAIWYDRADTLPTAPLPFQSFRIRHCLVMRGTTTIYRPQILWQHNAILSRHGGANTRAVRRRRRRRPNDGVAPAPFSWRVHVMLYTSYMLLDFCNAVYNKAWTLTKSSKNDAGVFL